jgi:hypothetical protein
MRTKFYKSYVLFLIHVSLSTALLIVNATTRRGEENNIIGGEFKDLTLEAIYRKSINAHSFPSQLSVWRRM